MRLLLLLTFSFGIASCDGANEEEELTSGPCVINYEDPLMTLQSVSDETSGVEIPEVYISNITREGNTVNLSETQSDVISNLTLDSDGLGGYCTLPCSALVTEGSYSIQLSANGYETKNVVFEAEYGTFGGNCPAFYREGIFLNLSLTPES